MHWVSRRGARPPLHDTGASEGCRAGKLGITQEVKR